MSCFENLQIEERTMDQSMWKKYDTYVAKNSKPRMPDRGYSISGYLDRLAGHYTTYFISKTPNMERTSKCIY